MLDFENNSGRVQMNKKYFGLFAILALIVASIACGTSNTGVKVGDATSAPTTESAKAITYKVGDVIELQDHRITLNGGDYKGGILKVNFTTENTGTKDMTVSSLISFDAKDADGTKLDQSIMDCGTSMDGKVLAGDKLKGDICYTLAKPGLVKIYYTASLFGSGATVWELDTATLTGIPTTSQDSSAPSTSTVKTYNIGDVIELQDQKITLNSANIAGNIIKANFTIENTGTSDLAVSSLISFSAKGPDGSKLDQNIMDCSTAQIDGKVLSGDKVKGDICWDLAGAKSAKIYYEASFLGSGAVVWNIGN
jgi:chitodextrinase